MPNVSNKFVGDATDEELEAEMATRKARREEIAKKYAEDENAIFMSALTPALINALVPHHGPYNLCNDTNLNGTWSGGEEHIVCNRCTLMEARDCGYLDMNIRVVFALSLRDL